MTPSHLRRCITALALTALAARAHAVEVVIEDDVVRGIDDSGAELWTWEHPGAARADGRPPARGEGWEGPVRIGSHAAWAISDRLFIADVDSGRIEHRVLLPQNPRDIEIGEGVFVLEPSRRGRSGQAVPEYHVAVDGTHDVPWLNPRAAQYQLRDDAERTVLRAAAVALDREPAVSWDSLFADPTWRPALASIEPLLLDRARRDATSPWWSHAAARVALALGREHDARARLDDALAIDLRYADELVEVASEVDALPLPDAPELARAMLRRGSAAMYLAGFEPSSACAPQMEHLSRDPHERPPADAAPVDRLEAALFHGERVWWLYPTCNEAGRVVLGLSQALAADGRDDEAAMWRERAWRSQRDGERIGSTIDRPSPDHTGAGLARAAALAALLSALVLGLELLSVTGTRRRTTEIPRGLVPRGELVLIALLAVPVIEQGLHLDWDDISHTEMPLEVWVGSPGAPALRAPLQNANAEPGGRIPWAWHLLHAGDLDAADAAFATRPDDARALANRGVIAARRGDDAAATVFFERALVLEPDLVEVSAMLGRDGDSILVEHRRALGAPLVAPVPPRPDQSAEGWIAVALTDGIPPEPEATIGSRVPLDPADEPWSVVIPALAVLALLALALPRSPDPAATPPAPSRAVIALRALVPGLSPTLRGVRPAVWFAAIALIQAALAWWASDGATINPFDVYQHTVYPISESGRFQAPLPRLERASWWWAWTWLPAWLVHAALVLALERRAAR